MTSKPIECIGLIPAAGKATRLGRMPCSKEVYPLMTRREGDPHVMADCLLGAFKEAGIQKTFFIIREGKWDIPAYFGDGSDYGLNIGYLMMGVPWGTPFTLDQAYAFVKGKRVALGFPDMHFQPAHIFRSMLKRLDQTGADVVLGAIPQQNGGKWDMIEYDEANRVRRIDIKRPDTDLDHCWFSAVWSPDFTEFMHQYLAIKGADYDINHSPEIYVGDAVRAAMEEGFNVQCEIFSDGEVIDLGTPEDLGQWLHSR